MRSAFTPLLLSLSLTLASGIASAQSTVDMTGTWTGTSKSIVSGLPAHHPATLPATIVDGHRLTELKITVKIDGQEDRRFWGMLGSATKVEPVIGVIAPDGKRVRMVTQGSGVIEGTLLENGSLELFYTESKAGVSVAATNLLTREK